jgi:regulator of RNase E activity RraA
VKLPVFCIGRRPYDSSGRGIVIDYDVRIVIDGVAIDPGDLVFGDADGLVIVPRSREIAVLERAWNKVGGENLTRQALQQGRSLAEVYQQHGVL